MIIDFVSIKLFVELFNQPINHKFCCKLNVTYIIKSVMSGLNPLIIQKGEQKFLLYLYVFFGFSFILSSSFISLTTINTLFKRIFRHFNIKKQVIIKIIFVAALANHYLNKIYHKKREK